MRIGRIQLLLAVPFLFAGAVRAEENPSEGRPITIIAGADTLKVGTRCQVELEAVTNGWDETVIVYEGKIAKANAKGIGLTVTEQRTVVRKTPFAKNPLLDRLSRNVGIGRPKPGSEKEVWVPSETIHSVRLIDKQA